MTKFEKLALLTPTVNSDSLVDNILRISLDIGAGLLRSGAEIHRVELAIEKICHAYGAAHVEVFTINSLILASIRMNDGSYSSQNRRITSISTNLRCMEQYNSLSRKICIETPDFEEVDAEIREIKKKDKYPLWLILIGYIFASGGFAVFFGGSLLDALAAGIIGLVMGVLAIPKNVYGNDATKTLALSFAGGMLTCLSVMLGIGENMDMIAIGTIMLVIPGLWLSNATRDLLYADTLAGTVKTVQAVITAIMIAIGYAISIFLLGKHCPVYSGGAPFVGHWRFVAGMISSVAGTIGFALIFKIALRKLWIVSICGLLAFVVYEGFLTLSGNILVASFASAIALALLSEICARVFRAPTNMFLFPGCIPIIPGSALYYTMYNLLSLSFPAALESLKVTAQTVLGIALGFMLVSISFSGFTHSLAYIKAKRNK